MPFDRKSYERALRDAGGAFADVATAERVIRDCGGAVKAVEKRVVEREGGHATVVGECVAMVTAVEPSLVLDERQNKQQVVHAAHAKQNYTVNGPHEFIEYCPVGAPPGDKRKNGKKA